MKLKKLNTRGFSHDIVIALFVVIFAIAGVAYLVASHADTIGWSGWTQFPPGPNTTLSGPAAVSWGTGRIDLVIRGTDNALYWQHFQSGSGWSGWSQISPPNTTYDAPTISSWSAGRLDVFVRGTDNHVYHKYFNGSAWSGWEALGGTTGAAPSAVSWGPNRVDVFVTGTNGAIYQKYWGGSSWSPAWQQISGANSTPTNDNPAVASWGAGRLDVFIRGTDSALYHMSYNNYGSWSGWQQLSGPNTTPSGPTATSQGYNQYDVFVRGTDNNVYWKHFNGSSWSGWSTVSYANTTYATPGVASWGTGRIDLFVQGTDNAVYWKYYGDIPTPAPPPTPSPPAPLSSYVGPSGPAGYDVGCTEYSNTQGCVGQWWQTQGGPFIYTNPGGAKISNYLYVDDTVGNCTTESCEQGYINTYESQYPGWTIYAARPLSYATPLTGPNVVNLVEWLPYQGDSAMVTCGSPGYILQRYFNGALQSSQYSGFNNLWDSAANCGPTTKPLMWY